MPTDHIRYDLLVQEALRSVVRKVLGDAARNGLPGDHHFYISFKTHAPGVTVPAAMRQKYPDEMTIILQHEFWDLSVNGEGFEVSLSFSRKPERLAIPFAAITGFSDPSVPTFGFKFMVPEVVESGTAPPATRLKSRGQGRGRRPQPPKAHAGSRRRRQKRRRRQSPRSRAVNPAAGQDNRESRSGEGRFDRRVSQEVTTGGDGMGEVVNLRRARKRQARAKAEIEAAANRIAFGVSKNLKTEAEAERALASSAPRSASKAGAGRCRLTRPNRVDGENRRPDAGVDQAISRHCRTPHQHFAGRSILARTQGFGQEARSIDQCARRRNRRQSRTRQSVVGDPRLRVRKRESIKAGGCRIGLLRRARRSRRGRRLRKRRRGVGRRSRSVV